MRGMRFCLRGFTKMVDFTWKIGGAAGFGVMSAGLIFSKAFSRGGYHVFDYSEYPSLIRGGHNTHQTRVSSVEIHSQNLPVHVLVALNRETIDRHGSELADGGVIIYDGERLKDVSDSRAFSVPFSRLARACGGEELMANNVSLGASVGLLGYDIGLLREVIADVFSAKGAVIVNANVSAAVAGYDYVKQNFGKAFAFSAKRLGSKKRYLLTGNEAVGAGAIAAGCKFYAGYPMTPVSSLLAYMSQRQTDFGVVVKQCEDEISVINTAIGAGFAGVRAMVGTAGGGFALMSEGYGLAAMTETPVVIVVGQRPGPATGLPTWTGQADLRFVMHAHQDDFPRIVIAPGDVGEAFWCAGEAFNIAEKYQTPVILLTDKYLGESRKTADGFDYVKIDRGELVAEGDGNYLRYKVTDSGVSPRALPGTKGAVVVANSDEHVESGQSTEESVARNSMMEKRMRKLEVFRSVMPLPKVYGTDDAGITILGFGSVKGPVLEALGLLGKAGISVNFIHVVYVSPFPEKEMCRLLERAKRLLVVENNFAAQFAGVVREYTGVRAENILLKYDGRPFYPEEIVAKVRSVVKK